MFITVLYQPILGIYLEIFNCRTVNSQLVLDHFPTSLCYSGSNIIICFVAVLMILIICIYAGLMNLIFFSFRLNSSDFGSKTSGRGDFALFLFKTILICGFQLFNESSFQVINLILLFLGDFGLFTHYALNVHYNNLYYGKLIFFQHSITFWTSICVVLG